MLHGEELKDNNGIALRAGNYYSIRPKVFAGTVSFLDGAGYIYNPGFGSHLITHRGQGETIRAESLHRMTEIGNHDSEIYRGITGVLEGTLK